MVESSSCGRDSLVTIGGLQVWQMASTNGRRFLVVVESSSCGRDSLLTVGGRQVWQMVSTKG